MTEFRIICVKRDSRGELIALGYSGSGTGVMYDDLWTLEEARGAIEAGHRLYTVSVATGERAELEIQNDAIRPKPGKSRDNDLDVLPECG